MPAKPISPPTTVHRGSGSSRAGIPMGEGVAQLAEAAPVAGIPAGVGVVKLTAAGNAVWCDYGPDFIFNRLEVSGPDERLYDFIGAASGPGFVDWRPGWDSVSEHIYFEAGRGGARSGRKHRPQI